MSDAPVQKSDDQPAGERPAGVDWEAACKGIGCSLLLLIIAVTAAWVSIFQTAGGTIGARLAVCGLCGFGAGLGYQLLRR